MQFDVSDISILATYASTTMFAYHIRYVACMYNCMAIFFIYLFEGLSVNIQSGKFKCKLFVIAGTLDLIAKAPALNMIQFNGLYGCSKCMQKGKFNFFIL